MKEILMSILNSLNDTEVDIELLKNKFEEIKEKDFSAYYTIGRGVGKYEAFVEAIEIIQKKYNHILNHEGIMGDKRGHFAMKVLLEVGKEIEALRGEEQ